jgi:glycine cleavage system aminomethyltransferase T
VIHSGDREVGRIGSACVSPGHGAIALALVRREIKPGDAVEVGGERVPAQVVELPF